MTTTTRTESDQKVIDRVERELVSGQTFQLKANSNRSVRKGGAPIAARHYGQIVETLGRFAADGDWATAVVTSALRGLNPYLTPNEVVAQVAQALADFAREPYFDDRGRAQRGLHRPRPRRRLVRRRADGARGHDRPRPPIPAGGQGPE